MAVVLSVALMDRINNHAFLGQAQPATGPYYVGLGRNKPDPDGSGANEFDASDYARQLFTDSDGSSNGEISNTASISFTGGALSSWGRATWALYYDAPTGGNFIYAIEIATPTEIVQGAPFALPPGNVAQRFRQG